MSKILVIEDESYVRQSILELLTFEDYEVIAAENGYDGVHLAQKEVPDLIICDVLMPELDGHEVLKILRQQPLTASIPFIFLTAKSEKRDFRKGMELGADDYLTKPFTRAELLSAITCRLEKQDILQKQAQQKLEELRNSIALSLPHEMRTPLNGILGFSELLIKDADILPPHEVREMAECIYKSGERLFRLIQNFLLYSELEIIMTDEQRRLGLQSYKTEFPSRILISLIAKKAKEAGRDADIQVSLPNSCYLSICETRLLKVFEELIDNALKFSLPGTAIQIKSSLVNNYQLSLLFVDCGRGMTASQIAELGAYRQFDRQFYEQQGSGLGLIITKRLVELHGGEMTINSKIGEGTTVQILLPIVK